MTSRWSRILGPLMVLGLVASQLLIGVNPAAALGSISGTVFEDTNYGGGPGRSMAGAAGVPLESVRVELYDSAGIYLESTLTGVDGTFVFPPYPDGAYAARVVHSTAHSTRPGPINASLVQVFRSDWDSEIAGAGANSVGGFQPYLVDSAANTSSLNLAALTSAAATPQSVVWVDNTS